MVHVVIYSISTCWPGFGKAWNRSDSHSLATAIAFAWFFCWLLISTFIWTEWFPYWIVLFGWAACGLLALTSFAKNAILGEKPEQDTRRHRDQNFRDAQASYLQASYFEAEKLLSDNLVKNPSDVESALLLVSVYRRTGRWDHALDTIQQLQRREMAVRWSNEIAVEKERCLRGKRQTKELPPPTP